MDVYGEQYTDQGNIGVTVDGGGQRVVSTVPADGVRRANVVVARVSGLPSGSHTVTVTKLSGQFMTFDGFQAR